MRFVVRVADGLVRRRIVLYKDDYGPWDD